MNNPMRRALLLALVALMLMGGAGTLEKPAPPPAAPELIAEKDGCRLYADAAAPQGAAAVFDRETLYRGLLVCVRPDLPLPDDLPAPQSRDVRSLVGLYLPAAERVSLSGETIYALCDLMGENPLENAWITAGMRSPQEQRTLQRAAFDLYQRTMPVAQALAQAEADVPDSGRSEHQLATVFDLRLTGPLSWSQDDPMARNADGRWLLENGWRWGLIRRYPPEKAALTRISGEAAHWRYVGRTHAAAMRAGDFCLEEYLDLLHARGSLRLETPDGQTHWLLCRPMADTAVFEVPAGYTAAVSADNTGFAICALSPAP